MSAIDCKICGWQGLRVPHHGAIDCLNAYRAYTEELRGLLPQGQQVVLGTIDRESTVRIWIEGPITHFGLERIKKYVEFMQEAYGLDTAPVLDTAQMEADAHPAGEPE